MSEPTKRPIGTNGKRLQSVLDAAARLAAELREEQQQKAERQAADKAKKAKKPTKR